MKDQLTILNLYDLTTTAEAFCTAITALVDRVEQDGHQGVKRYRFFVDAAAGKARAVIDYDNPAAWIGHHDIAMDWPEMKALHAVATLEEITFLGANTPEIRQWIAGSELRARIVEGNRFVAGFERG